MRRFTKLTLLLAMLLLASSDLYAAPAIDSGDGTDSTVAGIGNAASGKYSGAFGYKNKASGSWSSAFGYYNTASGLSSSAFGNNNEASGANSSAFGMNNTASSDNGFSSAFGFGNTAEGNYSSAFGYENKASGANSSAFGMSSYAIGDNSTAIGYKAVANDENTVSFGHGIGDNKVIGGSYTDELNSRLVHVAEGIDDTDAVNYGQFKLAYTNASFDSQKSQLTLKTAGGDTKVIDIPTGGGSSLTEAQLAAANSGITSAKVTAYDTYITSTGITGGNKRITNVAAATEDTDAVNYGQMKQYVADNAGGSGSDPELKKTIEQHTKDIKQLLANLGTSAEKENKPSEGSIAIGDSNEAGTEENTSMAIGSGNKVTGKDSIAIGYSSSGVGNTVSGNNSIAVGFGHQITGNNSGAFGDPTIIDSANSYAVGNNNHITGDSSFALGNNVNISAQNGVALGNNTEVSAKNAVAIGEGSKATEENTVSVGSDETKRRITNVDKAKDGTDAVNYDQMKDYISENVGDVGEIIKLRQDVAKMDSRVSKVGASAAALAALKPMEFDPENKWSAGVGFGNLNGKSAAAIGIFYRPSRDVYYSLGGNVGGEENIVNAGVSFSFGHRSARPAVNQYASADNNEIEAYRQENAELKNKVNTLENKNNELETRMKRLERLIIKMSKEDK